MGETNIMLARASNQEPQNHTQKQLAPPFVLGCKGLVLDYLGALKSKEV